MSCSKTIVSVVTRELGWGGIFLLFALLLGACTASAPAQPTATPCIETMPCTLPDVDGGLAGAQSIALTPVAVLPVVEEPLGSVTGPAPAEEVQGGLAAMQSATGTYEITAVLPTATSFQICSPLGWETLPELAEIVGDPYKPPPPERAEERHHGVDFSHWSRKGHPSIEGEPVQAVLSGIVAASISNRLPYGNMLILETPSETLPAALVEALRLEPGQSLYLLYAHMQQAPTLKVGEAVTCGQELGLAGAVGYNVVNAHLHLEMRRGPAGVRFESMAFYTTDATPEEMAAYQRWRTGGEFVHFDPFLLLNASAPSLIDEGE